MEENDPLHFWDEAHNKICDKCGCECEWNGECSECGDE